MTRFSHTNRQQDLDEALMLDAVMRQWVNTLNIQHMADGRPRVEVST